MIQALVLEEKHRPSLRDIAVEEPLGACDIRTKTFGLKIAWRPLNMPWSRHRARSKFKFKCSPHNHGEDASNVSGQTET